MINIPGPGTHREDFNNTENIVQETRKMKLITNEPQLLLPVSRMEGHLHSRVITCLCFFLNESSLLWPKLPEPC